MPGIPRELVKHALNVDPKARTMKQPLRRFDEPKRKAIAAKLHCLENIGFIKKIKTSSWVSNPIIVPKKNIDVCRICVDYTALNKHCPKDPFHYPGCINNRLYRGLCKAFLLGCIFRLQTDQIKVEDKEKVAFITPYGVYSYQVMPFGLKTRAQLTNG
jgi:hypothetical protein